MKNTKTETLLYTPGANGGLPGEICSGRSLALFSAVLFLLVILTAQEAATMLCVLLGFGVLLTAVMMRKRPISGRLGALFLLVTLYVLWAGISCFHSPYSVVSLKE